MKHFVPLAAVCGLVALSIVAMPQPAMAQRDRYLKEPVPPGGGMYFYPSDFAGEDPPDTVGPWIKVSWAGPDPKGAVYYMARYPFPMAPFPSTKWALLSRSEFLALSDFSRSRDCIAPRDVLRAQRSGRVALFVDFHQSDKVAVSCNMSLETARDYLDGILKLPAINWRNNPETARIHRSMSITFARSVEQLESRKK